MSDKTDDTSNQQVEPARKLTPAELVASDPARYRLLSSGAVFDNSISKIVAVDNGKNPHAITKENSLAMHQRRAELAIKAQSSARKAVAEHLQKPSFLEAWGHIVGCQSKLATDTDKTRSVEAARFVGEATGAMVKDRGGQSSDVPAGGMQLNIGAEALATILEAVNKRKAEVDNDVIDV